MRAALTTALAVALVGWSGEAVARRSDRLADRVAIADFRGPEAGRIQEAVEAGLIARFYVVPDFNVARVARAHGVRLQPDADAGFGVVGRSLEVAGFVSAQVRKRGTWQVRLEVRRGDTGVPVGSLVLAHRRLDGLEARVARQAPARVERLLARATIPPVAVAAPVMAAAPVLATPAPVVALPAPVVTATPVVTTAPVIADSPLTAPPPLPAEETMVVAASRTAPGIPWAELALDARVFTRSLRYAQNLSGLPDYDLPRALAAALDLTVHPAATLSRRLAPLSMTAALEYAPGVTSRASGRALPTSVHGYRLGLGWRFARDRASLSPRLGYGAHTFETGEAAGAAPDARYRFVWLGADGRFAPLPWLGLFAGAAYLQSLAGSPSDAFPRATAGGLSVEAGAAVPLARTIELRLTAGLRRFGLAMHSRPGDRWVAGGAVDQMAWVGLGLAFRAEATR